MWVWAICSHNIHTHTHSYSHEIKNLKILFQNNWCALVTWLVTCPVHAAWLHDLQNLWRDTFQCNSARFQTLPAQQMSNASAEMQLAHMPPSTFNTQVLQSEAISKQVFAFGAIARAAWRRLLWNKICLPQYILVYCLLYAAVVFLVIHEWDSQFWKRKRNRKQQHSGNVVYIYIYIQWCGVVGRWQRVRPSHFAGIQISASIWKLRKSCC